MLRRIFLATFFGIALSAFASANQVTCDVDEMCPVGVQCCIVVDSVIDSPAHTFSDARNDATNSLDFIPSRNVKFLPIHVHKVFSNLVSYDAKYCKIQNLSKENFEKLFHLRKLNLNNNRIETLDTNIFEDTTSLEVLLLENNKIESIVGQLSLQNLKLVNLKANKCINEEFPTCYDFNERQACKASSEVFPFCESIGPCEKSSDCCQLTAYSSRSFSENRNLVNQPINNKVESISYGSNPAVEYLISGINKTFKNLKHYDASNCAVRGIFQDILKGLLWIETVDLSGNQISEISRHSFKHLFYLTNVNLANNKIKYIASNYFLYLSRMVKLDFTNNSCIDEKLNGFLEYYNLNAKCITTALEANSSESKCSLLFRCDFGFCCEMDRADVVNSTEFVIAAPHNNDNRPHRLDLSWSYGMLYLPLSTHYLESLIAYEASNSRIQQISRKNFKGMIWVERIELAYNKIQRIESDTFEGLFRLKVIDLTQNNIKHMLSFLFDNLPILELVRLIGNDCINAKFTGNEIATTLPKAVNETCGYVNTVTEISCEKHKLVTGDYPWWEKFGCEMITYTIIQRADVTIYHPSDENAFYINFNKNRNIHFLPISIYQNFPNLSDYAASKCSIREVSKKNFQRLHGLKVLNLSGNRIFAIASDTFEDLERLYHLRLDDNKIKYMNGKLLDGKELEHFRANFTLNECIAIPFECGVMQSYPDTVGVKCDRTAIQNLIASCAYPEMKFSGNEVTCSFEDCSATRLDTCCIFDNSTSINTSNFTIANGRDEAIVTLVFEKNPKIKFLPVGVFSKFDNLLSFKADHCAISNISRENFLYLVNLRNLSLAHNLIEIIKQNTFEGLSRLSLIELNNNPIKSMNGRLFEGHPILSLVNLTQTHCIDLAFSKTQLKGMYKKVTERCGFNEVGNPNFDKVFANCSDFANAGGYIIGGEYIKPGEWPFLAALLKKADREFFCGGNLITSKHILTAAHCVHEKYKKPTAASEIFVLLGRHSLESETENNSVARTVESVIVHPNWDANAVKFNDDIAILVLIAKVKFSPLIQPICVTGDEEIMQLEDGYVVGWGKGITDDHEDVPKQALIRAVNDSFCFDQEYSLGRIFSQHSFCAKGDGAGPCLGDSGGGFYVRFGGLWTLRGVVSAGPSDILGGCEADRFALYTKVIEFIDWVKNEVQRTNRTKYTASLFNDE